MAPSAVFNAVEAKKLKNNPKQYFFQFATSSSRGYIFKMHRWTQIKWTYFVLEIPLVYKNTDICRCKKERFRIKSAQYSFLRQGQVLICGYTTIVPKKRYLGGDTDCFGLLIGQFRAH